MSYITVNGVNYAALPPQGTTTDLSGSYILSGVSDEVHTDTSNGIFVAPFIANMYADASGTVGVLQQTTVQILDIDHKFDITLSVEDSVKILKGFKVSDTDASGGVSYDPSANVQVDLRSEAGEEFRAALADALASSDLSDGTVTLKDWLKAEAQADVTALLSFDSLANLLEASVLSSFGIELDASGGATNMWNTINSSADDGAARRRAFFTQLTEDRVEKYALVDASGLDSSNERVAVMNFLPLVKGDILAMVFDVVVGDYTSPTAPTTGAVITRVRADNGPVFSGASTANSYIIGGDVESNFQTGDITISKPTLRRVAVQLKFAGLNDAGDAFSATRTGDAQSGYILSLSS